MATENAKEVGEGGMWCGEEGSSLLSHPVTSFLIFLWHQWLEGQSWVLHGSLWCHKWL